MSGQLQEQQPGPSAGFSEGQRKLPHEPCQQAVQAVKHEVARLARSSDITTSIEELMEAVCEYLNDDLALGYGQRGVTPGMVELRFRTVVDKMKICSRQQDCVSYLDICKNVHADFDSRVTDFFLRQDDALLAQKNRDKEREKLKQIEWQKWHDYLDKKFAELVKQTDDNGDNVVNAGLRKKASMVDVLQDEKATLQQLLDKATGAVEDMNKETAAKTSEIMKLQSELQGLSSKDGTSATSSHSSDKSPVTPSSPSRSGPSSPRSSREASQKLLEAQKKVLDTNKLLNEAEEARREAEQDAEALRQENADLRGEFEQERESLQSRLDGTNTHLSTLKEAYDGMEKKLNSSLEANAKLYDELCDAKGNLRVVTRVRPPLDEPAEEVDDIETEKGDLVDELQYLGIPNPKRQTSMSSQRGEAPPVDKLGPFEKVFDKTATNADIFEEVKPVIGSAFSGKSVCVFAYGQSGSGKTYTIGTTAQTSSLEEGGLIPRSMAMLADWIEKRNETWQYDVHAQFLEIYAEKAYDLLGEKKTEVNLKYDKLDGKQSACYYADCSWVEVTHEGALNMSMVDWVLETAAKKRETRSTVKNSQSSRSHSLLTLRIAGQRLAGAEDGGVHLTEGILNLIDLAGSEKFSPNDEAGAAEGIQINKSLMALRKVINDMSDPKATRTSFRESTLTKLLEPCLGKGSKVIMLAMVSPMIRDREETRNTLRFAESATQAKMQTLRAPDNLSAPSSSSASASSSSRAPPARPSRLPVSGSTPVTPAKPSAGRPTTTSRRPPPPLNIPSSSAKGRPMASPPSVSGASPRTPLRPTNNAASERFRNDLGKQPLVRLERRTSNPPRSPSSFRERIASTQGNHGNEDSGNPPPSKLSRSNAVRRPSHGVGP